MTDDIENGLVVQIRPVFPQFSDKFIREAIKSVRTRFAPVEGQIPNVAVLLPTCIDYLLDLPQENGRFLTDIYAQENSVDGFQSIGLNDTAQNGIKNANKNNRPVMKNNGHDVYGLEEDIFDGAVSLLGLDDATGSSDSGQQRLEFDMRRRDPLDNDSDVKTSSSSSSSRSSSSSSSTIYDNEWGGGSQRPYKPAKQNGSITPITHNTLKTAKNKKDVIVVNDDNVFKPKGTLKEDQVIMDAYQAVFAIVPDVEKKFALNFLRSIGPTSSYKSDIMANQLVEYLFENKSYPKKSAAIINDSPKPKEEKQVTEEVDYYSAGYVYNGNNMGLYAQQSVILLMQKFRKISHKSIKRAYEENFCRYARTHKYIIEQELAAKQGKGMFFNYIQLPRQRQKMPAVLHELLEKEIKFIEADEKRSSEAADHDFALSLNEEQYEQEGQLIECGCCYGEAVFEKMIQCIEGHLFCGECLRSYAKEAIYGAGKMQLTCMTNECPSSFPLSQLKKALDKNMIEKYQERLQEESIKMAELPDLVRCPSCDFAAEMPAGDKVFKCQNSECMKETCRYCKEPWKDHFGIPCEEVEKKDVTNLRVSYEEKMSMAKIRTCAKCGCGFMKTDGCNKMTCRCGTTMCYICRKTKIGYDHFCNHPRDPGKGCTSCKNCSLWSDPKEDDERAVKELKEEALREAAKFKDPPTENGTTPTAGVKRPLTIGPPEEHHKMKKHKKHDRHRHYNY